jgi:hypothetical protein
LAVGYRSIRTRALRWIGFSEDDAKTSRERARWELARGESGTEKLGGKAALVWQRVEDSAFHLRALGKISGQRVEDNAFHLRALGKISGRRENLHEIHIREKTDLPANHAN